MSVFASFQSVLLLPVIIFCSFVHSQSNAQTIIYSRSLIQDGYFFKPQDEVSESDFKQIDQVFRFAYSNAKKRLLLNIASLSRGELSNTFNQINAAEVRYKYNLKGNLVEKSQYDQKGMLISVTKLRYKKALVIEEQILDGKRKLFNSKRFRYDTRERLVESEFLDSKGVTQNTSLGYAVERRQYDEKNNLTQIIWFDKEKGLSRKRTATFDSLNNMIEERIFLAEEGETEVVKYRYDSTQRWIEKIETDLSESTYRKTTRQYDGDGNLLEESTYDFTGKLVDNALDIAKTTFEYQDGKKIREARFSATGVLRTDTRYNLFGNVVERVQYASDESVIEIKRNKFDSFGNLLEENFLTHNAKKAEVSTETRWYEKGVLVKKVFYDKHGNPR